MNQRTNGMIRYNSRSLISKNCSDGESVQMTNVNYTNFLSTLFELHTNHELRITNCEYAHSLAPA